MSKYIIPLTLFLFGSFSLMGQVPSSAVVKRLGASSGSRSQMMCETQNAGTIRFGGGGANNQSTDANSLATPIFLCFNDQVSIDHNRDEDFSGDSNPGGAGIGYGFYTCEPSVTGPTLGDVLMDPCRLILENPDSLVVFVGGRTGNVTFRNGLNFGDKSLQDSLNGGDPVQYWFAPITYDDLASNNVTNSNSAIYEDGENSCINVSIDENFSVVYLNEIEIQQVSTSQCGGELVVTGGFPEFNNGRYTVNIEHTTNNGVVGTITGPVRHNTPVSFTVPEAGSYILSISDSKNCSVAQRTIAIADCPQSMDFVVGSECPTEDIFVGEQYCIDINVSNFTDLVSTEFSISFDTSILEFQEIVIDPNVSSDIGLNIASFGIRGGVLTTEGVIKLSWLTSDFFNGSTLPENTTYFTACFVTKKEGEPNIDIIEDFDNVFEVFNVDNQVGTSSQFCSTIEILPVIASNLPARVETISPCVGEDNGKLSISIPENIGNPPFEIILRGSSGNPINILPPIQFFGRDTVIENLIADDYTYMIEDASLEGDNNSTRGNTRIREVNFSTNIIPEQPKCFGEASGTLMVIPVENAQIITDLEDYTFLWSNDSTTQTIDGLTTGSYSVTVTNPNGCTAFNFQPLSDPVALEFVPGAGIISTDATCSGTFDGTLRAEVEGGTGELSYEWDIDPSINNLEITNLDVGDYQLVVTDANGCSLIGTQSVGSASVIAINPTVDSITCFNANDGMIVAMRGAATTGFPAGTNFVFEWTDEDGNTITPSSGVPTDISTQVENLSPGTYMVRLSADSPTDPALSACFTTENFVLEEPDSLMLDPSIQSTTNCRTPNGQIELNPQGGTPDYTYAWTFRDSSIADPGNVNLVGSLPADTVTVVVTDANGCETTLDTIISSPMPPQVTAFENTALECADFTDGTLQVIAVPGESPITDYSWSHNTSVEGNFAGSLSPDVYMVTITDENDCITVDSAMVTAPPPIELSSIDTVQQPCFGDTNGSLSVTIIGGTPGYDYQWLNADNEIVTSNNPILEGASAGIYTIVGQDNNGCDFPTNVIVLPSLPEIVVDFSDIQGTSCFDNGLNVRDGRATAAASYADGSTGEFDFIWPTEQINGVSQSTVTSLGSGQIDLLVFETNGICSTRDSIDIPSPTELEYDPVNSSFRDITCNGGEDGSITVAAMGGTAPYRYMWDFEGSVEQTLTNLPQGSYQVTFTDANDCIAEQRFDLTEPEPLILMLDFDNGNTRDVVCSGQDDGQITVLASGANTDQGGILYSWLPNVSDDNMATNLTPGNYSITVIDALGCEDSITYNIGEPPPIQFNVGPNMDILCNGGVTTIVADPLSFSGGNGGEYMFSVDNSPAQTLDRVIQVQAGEHLISVFDSEGCQYDTVLSITEPLPITIEFLDAERNGNNFVSEVELGGQIALNPQIFSPLPIAENGLNWFSSNPADSTFFCNDITFCDDPVVSPLENTIYTLSITDQNGCMAEASITIEVDKNRNIFIPNAFAPNARGFDLNETFRVYSGVGVQNINYARVFDRWGTMVASIENTLPSASGVEVWDGRLNGDRVEQGVYVYIVSITFVDNTTLLYRGDVTVLR